MRDEFKNYFNNSAGNVLYNSSHVRLTLSVPIFDGLEKRSKSRQAKLDYQKTGALLSDTQERFRVNYRNALNNYYNNKSNVERQKHNIELATKVYDETALRYREGMTSMSDLLQDEMSLSSEQSWRSMGVKKVKVADYATFPSGKEGIRTPGALLELTRFPSVRLRPLGHLS